MRHTVEIQSRIVPVIYTRSAIEILEETGGLFLCESLKDNTTLHTLGLKRNN